jgi:DNA-binding PadR family transcriptional regulator
MVVIRIHKLPSESTGQRAPDGRLALQDLTASMVLGDALSRSGLTRMLDRMENDGLIRRKLNRRDRRRFDVALTRQGRARFEQVWPPHEDGIHHYFVEPLTAGDLNALRRILGKLIHVNDDWKRFEQDNMKPELYTLRRVQKI